MCPDRLSNPGPLTYESGALSTALHGPACEEVSLEEVNGQGGRTLCVNDHVFVTKASHTVIMDFGCG